VKGDERILGESEFVVETLQAAEEAFERKYALKSKGYDLQSLAARVGAVFQIDPKTVWSPGRYMERVKARSVFCYWAVRELGESATSLAKILGISQPAVSMSVKRGEEIVEKMGVELLAEE
jgi:chromosomal replication initiation ATPase DnaA